MTDSKGQQVTWEELTEAEQLALEHWTDVDRVVVNEIEKKLQTKGLTRIVRIDHNRHQNMLTERGRAVLAQAALPAAGDKPLTITAGSNVKASLDIKLSLALIKRNCRGVVLAVMGEDIQVSFEGVDNAVIIPKSFVDLCYDALPGEPTAEVLQSDWALEAVRQATTTLTDAAIRLEAMDDYIVQLQPQLATLTAERDAARAEAKALREALEKIAAKSDYIECPVMLEGEDPFSFGISRGLWRQSIIAREALTASEKGG